MEFVIENIEKAIQLLKEGNVIEAQTGLEITLDELKKS